MLELECRRAATKARWAGCARRARRDRKVQHRGGFLDKMRMRVFGLLALFAAASAASVGCSAEKPAGSAGTGGSGGTSGGSGASDVREDCTGAELIRAGLVKTSVDGYVFELVDVEPATPLQIDREPGNAWTLTVKNANGEAIKGGRLQVTKFMPVHNHPSPPDAWGFDQQDGRYIIKNLFFAMGGLFRITVELTLDSNRKESILYMLCIAHQSG